MDFTDLPLLASEEDARRIQRDSNLFLVNKVGGTAHGSPYDCLHIDPSEKLNKTAWRIATAAQVQALRFHWCESCS